MTFHIFQTDEYAHETTSSLMAEQRKLETTSVPEKKIVVETNNVLLIFDLKIHACSYPALSLSLTP
jgi:hypothetical protein